MSNIEVTGTAHFPTINLPENLIRELAGLRALEHLDAEDRPLPTFACNTRRRLPDGSWAPKDVFVNSITGEVKDKIECVLLHIKKSRRWATFSESSGMTEHCRSADGLLGIDSKGETADCTQCPHRLWGHGNGHNAVPDCDIVYTLLGIDLEDGNPFIVRARATSLRPVQRWLMRFFLGKLKLPDGSHADLPLFTRHTRLSLTMPTGAYAVLCLDSESPCTEAEIRTYRSIFDNLRGVIQPNSDDDNADTVE